MKIKEFEKKLQNTAGDSTKAKIHVEEEKKDAFRVLSHDTSGLKLISSYAGTVRVYMDEHLLFSLVPPHLMHADKRSWLAKKYGVLDDSEGLLDIKLGFREAMRVLKPTGTLLFKWNQYQIPFRLVLATIAVDGYNPILGDKRSKTRWSVFIKS